MSDEPEAEEVFLALGEVWFPRAAQLCERLAADYLRQDEGGDLFIGVTGKGEIPLVDALRNEGKTKSSHSGDVVPIK